MNQLISDYRAVRCNASLYIYLKKKKIYHFFAFIVQLLVKMPTGNNRRDDCDVQQVSFF